jgi:PIN domain nuclease of toxin-antitoxin system
MKILLDTHVFLWGIARESKLSLRVQTLLPSADCWFSLASVWEIVTKVQIGKLDLPQPAGPFVTARLAANGVRILPIRLDHVLRLESIDLRHRDPFDRMLVAQSLEEDIPLVSADPAFKAYPVNVIW